MNFINIKLEELKGLIASILSITDKKPFQCVYLSSILASGLIDHFKCNAKVITGDLIINGKKIFVQDYSLDNIGKSNLNANWSGHCWVLLDDRYIIDISLRRTINSPDFQAKYRNLNINEIAGKGAIILDELNNKTPLSYCKKGEVTNEAITSIIQPFLEQVSQNNTK